MKKSTLYFATAGVLLASSWLLYFFLLHDPFVEGLVYVGWVMLAVGLVFILLPMVVLRSKGKPGKGRDFTHTTTIVDKGIYAIVRHPLYLGWLLMYAAVILFSQHWLIAIMGILGIVCMCLIARQEDRFLIRKFGDAYEKYMKSVPALNVLASIIRLLRHQKEDSKQGAG